jgi:hypothetical protein
VSEQIVTPPVTEAEQAEMDRLVAELYKAGYVNLDQFTYQRSGRVLRVGARVRHGGEQYPEAFLHGTGNVVALVHRPNSGWSRQWRMPDIELVVLRDRARFASRLSQLAHYHVEVIPDAGEVERALDELIELAEQGGLHDASE